MKLAATGRSRTVLHLLVGIGVGALAVALLSLPVLVGQIRTTQVNNTQKSEARDKTLAAVRNNTKVIKDCTHPGGKCFQRGQRRTAAAVGDIGARNILAVVCALQVPNGTPLDQALEQVTDCVADRLSRPKA